MAIVNSIVIGRASGKIGELSYTPSGRTSIVSQMQGSKISTSSITAKANRLGFKNCTSCWWLFRDFLSNSRYYVKGRRSRYNLYISNCIHAFPDYKEQFFDVLLGHITEAVYRGSDMVKVTNYYFEGTNLIVHYSFPITIGRQLQLTRFSLQIFSLNPVTRQSVYKTVELPLNQVGNNTISVPLQSWYNSIYGAYIFSSGHSVCSDITFKKK